MMHAPTNDTAPASGRRSARIVFETGDHFEIARALLSEVSKGQPIVCDLGNLHTYDPKCGTWAEIDQAAATRTIGSFSQGAWIDAPDGKPKRLKLKKSDVDGAIVLAQRESARPDFFAAATPGIAFSNGFVRLNGAAVCFEPHAPEHRARFAYPFAYEKDAPCPKWLACLRDAFKGDGDADEKIAAIQEHAGASLFGIAPKYRRALVFYGDGANAKSTIAKVVAGSMPPGSTSAVEPQSWGQEYRRALLAGKLLNVVNEMPEAEILAGESFKNVITGEPSTARNPCFPAFTMTPIAGHLFCANRLPGTNDQSHGFWRRILVIVFNRVFSEREAVADLAEQILTAEHAGIIAWMIEGVARLVQRGHLTEPSSSGAAGDKWRAESNPVALFVEQKTRPATCAADRTSSTTLFDTFKEWAQRFGFKPLSIQTFGRRMAALKLTSEHTMKGEVYPVALLRPEEQNPRWAERAAAEAARESESAQPCARCKVVRPDMAPAPATTMVSDYANQPQPVCSPCAEAYAAERAGRAAPEPAQPAECKACGQPRRPGGCAPCGICSGCTGVSLNTSGACTC